MKINLLILLFISTYCRISAQRADDSLRTYKKDAVIISATREEILQKNSPSIMKVISKDDILKSNGSRLSEKLQQVNGIFLKDYGSGGLKTISLRGFGPEHCLVLFNGEKINSPQNGNVDLSNYLTEDIERIEILKGGNSAYYGSEALAGVINIIPKTISEKFSMRCLFSLGSFDYYKYFFKIENRINDLEFYASFNQEKSKNNFNFSFSDKSDQYSGERRNSDFITRQLQFGLNYKFDKSSSLNFFNAFNFSDKGIPDIILSPNYTARQKDNDLISMLVYKNKAGDNIDLKVSPSFHFSEVNYINPKLDTEQKKYESNSKNYTLGLNNQIKYLIDNMDLSGGLELTTSISNSNNYSGEKDRFRLGTFISCAYNIPNNIIPIILYPAIRYDHYSDFGNAVSPKIGLNIKIFNEDLIFKSSYSNNFRAPTFNELFWNPGGNPNLKPEKSNSFDLGITYKIQNPITASFEISFFDIRMNDRIIWLPSGGFIWEPKNIQNVKSNGFDVSTAFNLPGNILNINFDYSYNITRNWTKSDDNFNKFLPYIPIHTFKSSLDLVWENANLNLFYCLTGERFTSESNEKISELPYFHYLDGSISYKFKFLNLFLNLKMEINNIFNSEYVIMPYYPTALRNYKLNLSITY